MNKQLILCGSATVISEHAAQKYPDDIHFINNLCQYDLDMPLEDFLASITGITDSWSINGVELTDDEIGKYVNFAAYLVKMTDTHLLIERHEFNHDATVRNIQNYKQYPLKWFTEGFVYAVITDRGEFRAFATREEAIQFGVETISPFWDAFCVNVFRTTHRGGSTYSAECEDSYLIEMKTRIAVAKPNEIYSIVMEYTGCEIDKYDRIGAFLHGVWSNGTDKTYKDFEDETRLKAIVDSYNPVNADFCDDELD